MKFYELKKSASTVTVERGVRYGEVRDSDGVLEHNVNWDGFL